MTGSSTSDRDRAGAARRGFLLITGAKVWFLVSGTVLHMSLPRLLGDPSSFGDFGVVNTFVSILNMVILAGALQTTARRVSETPGAALAIRRRAVLLQGGAGLALALAVAVAAGPLSAFFFGDATLAPYLRLAIVVTASYGAYASLIGLVNGLERFDVQAGFDVAYSTLKLALIVGFVAAGAGVLGAFGGFALASISIGLAAFFLTRRVLAGVDRGEAAPPLGLFVVEVMGYTLFVQLLVQVDVLVVKAAALEPVGDALAAAPATWTATLVPWIGVAADPAREITSALAGLFRATRNISLVPYQAVIAVTFVAFPLIARSTAESDPAATRTWIRGALRTTLLLVLALATAIGAGGDALLALLFGPSYALAGPSLLPLLAGMSAFAVFYVILTVLAAAGRPRDALVLAAATSTLQIGLTWLAVASSAGGPDLLGRAALAVGVSLALGLAASAAWLARRHPSCFPVATLVRASLAAAAAVGAAAFVPGEGLPAIFLRACTAGSVYLAVAVAAGELTRDDLALVRGTLRRRRRTRDPEPDA